MIYPTRFLSAPSSRGRARGAARLFVVVLAVLVLLVAGALSLVVGKYNTLQANKTAVESAFGEIDNQYKRRNDLIDNLVATVKGAADFEQETLTEITEARAQVGKMQLPDNFADNPEQLERYMQAQQGLGSALQRLLVVAENYPQLRATDRFGELQAQLEGTENRIAVARRDYIDTVQLHNTFMRQFPNSAIAGIFNIGEIPQFSATDEERELPKVDFGKE